jgi:hypothetical protein
MINVKIERDAWGRQAFVHPSGASFAWSDENCVRLNLPFTRVQYEAFGRACGYAPTADMSLNCAIEWAPVARTPERNEALYAALGDAYTYVWALMGRVEYEQDDLLGVFAKREDGITEVMTYFAGTSPVTTSPSSTDDCLLWEASTAQPINKGHYGYLTLTKTPLK